MRGWQKHVLGYLVLHRRISAVRQVCISAGLHQCRCYFREHLYSQTSIKAWDSKEKQAFSSRLPLSRHIAWLATYPIDPGILISLYASAHHPYTTLATSEWMIFRPGEDTPIEVRSTECSCHLVFQSWTISRGQQKHFFGYLVLHKHISAVLKVCINADTALENTYTVKLAETVKKNRCFCPDCLWAAILHD